MRGGLTTVRASVKLTSAPRASNLSNDKDLQCHTDLLLIDWGVTPRMHAEGEGEDVHGDSAATAMHEDRPLTSPGLVERRKALSQIAFVR